MGVCELANDRTALWLVQATNWGGELVAAGAVTATLNASGERWSATILKQRRGRERVRLRRCQGYVELTVQFQSQVVSRSKTIGRESLVLGYRCLKTRC